MHGTTFVDERDRCNSHSVAVNAFHRKHDHECNVADLLATKQPQTATLSTVSTREMAMLPTVETYFRARQLRDAITADVLDTGERAPSGLVNESWKHWRHERVDALNNLLNDLPASFFIGEKDERPSSCGVDENDKIINLDDKSLTRVPACLENHDRLEILSLHNNRIGKIEGLDNVPKLNNLSLYSNRISRIEGLDNAPGLEYLSLGKNRISRIDGLDNVPKLNTLYLDSNRIGKIDGLDNVPKLKILSLHSNRIGKIDGLDNVPKLEHLYLYSNRIGKIEGLDNAPKLEHLYLYNNRIGKIEGLDNVPGLEILSLHNNRIDPSECKQFKSVAPFSVVC